MATYTAKGKIHFISTTRNISDRFSVREIIIDRPASDGGYIGFQVINAECSSLDHFMEGEEVSVDFTVSTRPEKKDPPEKYWTHLTAEMITAIGERTTPAPTDAPSVGHSPVRAPITDENTNPQPDDDVPF